MRKTKFNPQNHGFRFENNFKNEVRVFGSKKIPLVGKYLEMETNGLCGGMAFSALDYFHSRRPTPTVSSATSRLRKYLLKRQLDSFKYKDSWRFARWTRRSNSTISPKTLKNEIPKAKKSINRGNPVVLGLIGATRLRDIGNDNHQVICYGYNENTSGDIKLYIYDPNCPPSDKFTGELVLSPFTDNNQYSEHPGFRLERSPAGKSDTIWRGFFIQRYSKRSNPPVIRDTARGGRGRVRDHRTRTRRDHREQHPGPIVRDHRTGSRSRNRSGSNPKVRDHRTRK